MDDLHRFWLASFVSSDFPLDVVRYILLPFLRELIEQVDCVVTNRYAIPRPPVITYTKFNPRTTPITDILRLLDDSALGSINFLYMGRELQIRVATKRGPGAAPVETQDRIWLHEKGSAMKIHAIFPGTTLCQLLETEALLTLCPVNRCGAPQT